VPNRRAERAGVRDLLQDHGGELLPDPVDPEVRREDDLGVHRAEIGEDGEVTGDVLDQLELQLAWDLDRPVRDLDVREPEEFAESRIEGCKLIPLGEVQARAESELKKDDDIVIYCAHGVRSLHALGAMARMGFKRLRSLEGGICAWQDHLASASSTAGDAPAG